MKNEKLKMSFQLKFSLTRRKVYGSLMKVYVEEPSRKEEGVPACQPGDLPGTESSRRDCPWATGTGLGRS